MGCLLWILLLAIAAYFGNLFGRPWFRYYQYKDEMATAASYGTVLSDAEIRRRVQVRADSLMLPLEARQISIQRLPDRVVISSAYEEVIPVPLRRPVILRFRPRVEAAL